VATKKTDIFSRSCVQGISPPCDPVLEKEFPITWDYLTRNYEGSEIKREFPSLVIQRVSGGFLVTIQEHDLGWSKKVPFTRLSDLAGALEMALSNDEMYPRMVYKSHLNRLGLKKFERKDGDKVIRLRPWET
jgi:hypothetical protein